MNRANLDTPVRHTLLLCILVTRVSQKGRPLVSLMDITPHQQKHPSWSLLRQYFFSCSWNWLNISLNLFFSTSNFNRREFCPWLFSIRLSKYKSTWFSLHCQKNKMSNRSEPIIKNYMDTQINLSSVECHWKMCFPMKWVNNTPTLQKKYFWWKYLLSMQYWVCFLCTH